MAEARCHDGRRPASARVLLVEDEPRARDVMSQALDGAGFSVVLDSAGDVLRGAGGADPGSPPPAVLVAEIDSPPPGGGADGLALAEEARRRWPGMGVVFVTGRPSRLDGRALGRRDRFLAKPVAAVALVRAVRALAARR